MKITRTSRYLLSLNISIFGFCKLRIKEYATGFENRFLDRRSEFFLNINVEPLVLIDWRVNTNGLIKTNHKVMFSLFLRRQFCLNFMLVSYVMSGANSLTFAFVGSYS